MCKNLHHVPNQKRASHQSHTLFKARAQRNAFRNKEDDLFPEPGELRGIMAQLEALLELVEGNTKIQSNSEAA